MYKHYTLSYLKLQYLTDKNTAQKSCSKFVQCAEIKKYSFHIPILYDIILFVNEIVVLLRIGDMIMSKITIKELARMAGVSPTAVSFVLNGKPGVSEGTRKKVLDIIDQVGYTANISSRCLALKKSFNIALLYSESSSPFDDLFYFEVARGALERCNELGYNIVLNKIRYENGKAVLPGVITLHNADGVMIFQDVPEDVFRQIESYGAPAVVVDSYADTDRYTSIGISVQSIVGTALDYLISKGHRGIGLIATGFIPDFRRQVTETFFEKLASAGLECRTEWVMTSAHDEDSAALCARQILNTPTRPDAIFCTSDIYAIGALRELSESGISVPDDISVIGADNIIACRYLSPSLTTVDYDKALLGSMACEMLIRRISGESVESVRINALDVKERGSVGGMR